MFDKNNSSSINFNDFRSLWDFITKWEKVFRSFDVNHDNAIDKNELRTALTSFGNKAYNRKE